MVHNNNTAVVYLKPATGFPVPGEHLGLRTFPLVTDLKGGDILLRNLFVSSDPYLRGRMNEGASFAPSFDIGQPFTSSGVSEVLQSKNAKFPVGSIVKGQIGWEEYTYVPSSTTEGFEIIENARESKIPLSSYTGLLGMPGLTAYSSLYAVDKPKKGEIIYISAASGAVGQLVGQIAKLKGLRVIGSAGSDAKVDYLLNDLKFDAAFNYKSGNILENLRKHAPNGIDIYFDNVGGETLEAALEVLKEKGRVLVCGFISTYNGETYGIRNTGIIVPKRLTIRGFASEDHREELGADFIRDVSQWLLNGDIIFKEDIAQGLAAAPDAFVGMLQGRNFGKQVIKIADL
ncbi:hypothetical protein BGZ94_004112 [Podila epigama]|nr:hypothetical protein BGZ94_004112 [Podila epigama]